MNRSTLPIVAIFCLAIAWVGCSDSQPVSEDDSTSWVADAIFYQIFPERFRNGDPGNDPTRETLEYGFVPESWELSPWTGDWYERSEWEKQIGDHFYHNGVYHRRYGGDLQGVLERLGYLDSLGINAIYFNPLFYARSLHKYDGNTYHHIDPYFGPDPEGDLALMATETSDPSTWQWTAADSLFLNLITMAKQSGINIVIDGVWNHTGRDFFAFQDLREKQQDSRYRDWYIVNSFDDPATTENEFDYEGWWGVESLPEFADTEDGTNLHPDPKKYIFDATKRWMDPNGDGDPSDGIAGWRLDVVPDMPIGFWTEWNAYARSINPDVYTTSEVWFDAVDIIVEGGFSSTMNYYAFAFPVKGFLIDATISASEFEEMLSERRNAYPESVDVMGLLNLMDSHDTPRLSSMILNRQTEYEQPEKFDYDVMVDPRVNPDYQLGKPDSVDYRILRLVAMFQMTYVGAPMVYYGTEAGMWGADDPDDRMPMVWPELEFEEQKSHPYGKDRMSDAVAFDSSLHAYYTSIIQLRGNNATLRTGSFDVLHAEETGHVIAYERTNTEQTAIAVLNRGDDRATITLPVPANWSDKSASDLQTLWSAATGNVEIEDSVRFDLAPLSGAVTLNKAD